MSVLKNSTRRAHVVLPIEVVAGIDRLVGKRGRSAFLAQLARDEVQRLEQLKAIQDASGVWKDEDHPELKDGAEAWVRRMRTESETHFQEIEEHRDRS